MGLQLNQQKAEGDAPFPRPLERQGRLRRRHRLYDVTITDLRRIGVPDSAMENSPTLDDALRKLMVRRVTGVVDTEIGLNGS